MRTYGITVEREGEHWLIQVPDINQPTQADSPDDADDMARSLIADTTGIADDEIDDLRDRLSVHEAAGDTVLAETLMAELDLE